MWLLQDAVEFVSELNAKLKPHGYAVGLTGGVIFNGSSKKDIDVIIYPRGDVPPISLAELSGVFLANDLKRVRNKEAAQAGWMKYHGSGDRKHVEEWSVDNKRIDFFFLS